MHKTAAQIHNRTLVALDPDDYDRWLEFKMDAPAQMYADHFRLNQCAPLKEDGLQLIEPSHHDRRMEVPCQIVAAELSLRA